jgi:hypothetical protein
MKAPLPAPQLIPDSRISRYSRGVAAPKSDHPCCMEQAVLPVTPCNYADWAKQAESQNWRAERHPNKWRKEKSSGFIGLFEFLCWRSRHDSNMRPTVQETAV